MSDKRTPVCFMYSCVYLMNFVNIHTIINIHSGMIYISTNKDVHLDKQAGKLATRFDIFMVFHLPSLS